MTQNNLITPLVIECMAMNLHEKEVLAYLKDKGYNISRETYYRYKRKIKNSRFQRLSLIGKSQFVDQFLERIANIELINKEMWSVYRKETNNFKKALILEKIAELQMLISNCYEASQLVMEESIKSKGNCVWCGDGVGVTAR
jgi:hypothetical protein